MQYLFPALRPTLFCAFALTLSPLAGAVICDDILFDEAEYSVCRADPATEDIRLFLNDANAKPLGTFDAIKGLLDADEQLVFAMNGGMYHADQSPVGGFHDHGKDIAPLNTNNGKGNFYMLPNGMFWLTKSKYGGRRSAYVATTQYYAEGAHSVLQATQSGPMLVVNGTLHPKFNPKSRSKRIRNGVGQCKGGQIVFVISNQPVNFHSFATLFNEHLGCDSALYLDGVISRLYAPQLGRNDPGVKMGPMIGIVKRELPNP